MCSIKNTEGLPQPHRVAEQEALPFGDLIFVFTTENGSVTKRPARLITQQMLNALNNGNKDFYYEVLFSVLEERLNDAKSWLNSSKGREVSVYMAKEFKLQSLDAAIHPIGGISRLKAKWHRMKELSN